MFSLSLVQPSLRTSHYLANETSAVKLFFYIYNYGGVRQVDQIGPTSFVNRRG